jgi:uncharacterized membrane protein YphA (DoxX/SURF4 family)
MALSKVPDLLLRVGVAFAFLYPPLNALSDPNSWIGYFPSFMHGIVSDPVLLHTFGVVEVVIALWILSGSKVYIPAAVASVMLVAIVAFNMAQFQILFRDLSIAAMALALAVAHWPGLPTGEAGKKGEAVAS